MLAVVLVAVGAGIMTARAIILGTADKASQAVLAEIQTQHDTTSLGRDRAISDAFRSSRNCRFPGFRRIGRLDLFREVRCSDTSSRLDRRTRYTGVPMMIEDTSTLKDSATPGE